jgi:predicted nucleic-acid-binding protein
MLKLRFRRAFPKKNRRRRNQLPESYRILRTGKDSLWKNWHGKQLCAKNMEIVDANIVLRYLLDDHEVFSENAGIILENKTVYFPFEVCAEVVYVLEKVYDIPREKIRDALLLFIHYPNVTTTDKTILKEALKIYHSENVDFVDSILVGWNHVRGAFIHSFDKKVNRLCK